MKHGPARASISEVSDILLSFEDSHQLLRQTVHGVYFWKLLRVPVFFEAMTGAGLYGEPQARLSKRDAARLLPRRLANALCHSFTRGYHRRDVVIHEGGRKTKCADRFIDIHTHYLERWLAESGVDYEVLDPPHLGVHRVPASQRRRYVESFSLLSDALGRVGRSRPTLSTDEMRYVSSIKEALENQLGGVRVERLDPGSVATAVRRFSDEYKRYLTYFRRRRPKKLFLICSYGKEGAVAAARDSGVESVELQHGVMSRYNLGYHFPGQASIPYFPDKIVLFGDYWRRTTALPLREEAIIIGGFPHLYRQLEGVRHVERRSNQVLFISQGAVGAGLCRMAVSFARRYPAYDIRFKLHPGEVNGWRGKYPELSEYASSGKNLSVLESPEESLYRLFFQSAAVVGVFSTAVYEAIAAGCHVYLANLPGVETMSHLIESGCCPMVDDAAGLHGQLAVRRAASDARDFFYDGPFDYAGLLQ